ncbi:HAD family hydrolase [Angustibacter aerolatus]
MTQVVWDMDGTLLDSTELVPQALADAVAELGGPVVDRDAVVAAYARGVPEVIMEHLLGRPLVDGEAEAFYRRLDGAHLQPYDGVPEALQALRDAGQQVVVFTGNATRGAQVLFASAGVEVDLLVGGDQVARPKPAPDGLHEVAARLGVPVGELAYVGDAPADLGAARAAGALAVAAAWGHLHDPALPADVRLRRPQDVLRLLG